MAWGGVNEVLIRGRGVVVGPHASHAHDLIAGAARDHGVPLAIANAESGGAQGVLPADIVKVGGVIFSVRDRTVLDVVWEC